VNGELGFSSPETSLAVVFCSLLHVLSSSPGPRVSEPREIHDQVRRPLMTTFMYFELALELSPPSYQGQGNSSVTPRATPGSSPRS
jgi:hypothetical protein